MSLELTELRAFLVLADNLHFGRAAEALHISQPALSKQIQKLEGKLDGPLLVRDRRKVALTPAGTVLQERARALLREAAVAEQRTRMALKGQAGTLRIGFGVAMLAAGLGNTIKQFRQRTPQVQLSMRDMATPDQIAALEEGTIDVGFVRLPVKNKHLATAPVLEDKLMAVLPRGVSFAGGLYGLRHEPFVVISRSVSASYYEHFMQTCRAAGFYPRIVQEANELFTVLNLVQAGIGLSLAPRSLRAMRVPNIRLVDTKLDAAKWRVGVAWRREDRGNPLVGNFVSLARSTAPTAFRGA
jgi:DNA-binding transcriptional LysR family regulator